MRLPPGILVTGWSDPAGPPGHDARGLAAEVGWTPFLGPSAMACLRRLNLLLLPDPSRPVPIDTVVLARAIGLQAGGGTGRLGTTIDRLVQFKAAHWIDDGQLAAHTVLPRLNQRQLDKLEPSVRSMYQAVAAGETTQRLAARAFPGAPGQAPSVSSPAPRPGPPGPPPHPSPKR